MMQSKKVIHRFIALLLSFFATLALAHPGHGGNGASHDLEHLIWVAWSSVWSPRCFMPGTGKKTAVSNTG